MKSWFFIYRLGALGMALTLVVFFKDPIAGMLHQDSSRWISTAILFGFAALAGLLLVSFPSGWLERGEMKGMILSHGAALLSVLWLLNWCFVWLGMMVNMGDKAEMMVKHTAYLHLFGVGFSMAGYATGWMESGTGSRSARFLMTAGWAVSYMAWFNLFLEPKLQWLWAPGVGGLLAALSAFFISRNLRARVEAVS